MEFRGRILAIFLSLYAFSLGLAVFAVYVYFQTRFNGAAITYQAQQQAAFRAETRVRLAQVYAMEQYLCTVARESHVATATPPPGC